MNVSQNVWFCKSINWPRRERERVQAQGTELTKTQMWEKLEKQSGLEGVSTKELGEEGTRQSEGSLEEDWHTGKRRLRSRTQPGVARSQPAQQVLSHGCGVRLAKLGRDRDQLNRNTSQDTQSIDWLSAMLGLQPPLPLM